MNPTKKYQTRRTHISFVKAGDKLLYDGCVYTATDDANQDLEKDWFVDVQSNDSPIACLYDDDFDEYEYVEIILAETEQVNRKPNFIYKVSINTDAYRPRRCNKTNWEPGTMNDFMAAINGWNTIEHSLRELQWRLNMFQGGSTPIMEIDGAGNVSDAYKAWEQQPCNEITYLDKLCGVERTQKITGYGFTQGHFRISDVLATLEEKGSAKVLFRWLYDARQYCKNMDGCFMLIRREETPAKSVSQEEYETMRADRDSWKDAFGESNEKVAEEVKRREAVERENERLKKIIIQHLPGDAVCACCEHFAQCKQEALEENDAAAQEGSIFWNCDGYSHFIPKEED